MNLLLARMFWPKMIYFSSPFFHSGCGRLGALFSSKRSINNDINSKVNIDINMNIGTLISKYVYMNVDINMVMTRKIYVDIDIDTAIHYVATDGLLKYSLREEPYGSKKFAGIFNRCHLIKQPDAQAM